MHVDSPWGIDVHFAPVTFGLGDMTLTLCVSDGDGSTSHVALADLVSFLVIIAIEAAISPQ